MAKARKLAEEIANMDPETDRATRAKAHITELEALLYSRAGTKPRPDPPMTKAEEKIAKTDISDMTGKQLAHTAASKLSSYTFCSLLPTYVLHTGLSRTAADAAVKNTRGLHAIVDKLDLHTRTFVRLEEKIDTIRRAVTKYDKPVNMGQLRANPDLNPWLQGYIPFQDQAAVVDFFSSQDRSFELNRWILDTVKWNYNKFCQKVVEMLCTPEYRVAYSYPGKAL